MHVTVLKSVRARHRIKVNTNSQYVHVTVLPRHVCDRDDRRRARALFRLFQSTSSDSEAIKAFSAGAFIVVVVACVVCVVCGDVCVVVRADSRWLAIASSCAAMRASTGSTRSRLIVRMRSVSVSIDALEPGVTRRIFRVVPSGRPFARGFVSVDEFCARLPSLAARGGCCVSRVTGSVRSVIRGSLSIRFNSTNAAPSPRRCGSRVDARARRRVNFVPPTLGSIVRVRFAPGRFRGRQSASVAPASGTFHRKRATDRPIARSRTVTNDHPSLDPGGGPGGCAEP